MRLHGCNFLRTHLLTLIFVLGYCSAVPGQMRQIYVGNSNYESIQNLSFYSPSDGYVASIGNSSPWVGYTTDTGHTFTKRYITLSNVNWNGYSPNLTFGFHPNGVKAFDQNNLIVYGDYGLVPAILTSNNGGLNFTLVFLDQLTYVPNASVNDMAFPGNGTTGYAIDDDRILKTTNRGLAWSAIRIEQGSTFNRLIAVDDKTLFVYSTAYNKRNILYSSDGGATWRFLHLPADESIIAADFINADKGWVILRDQATDEGKIFYTDNAGANWEQKNDLRATPFYCLRMKFINDSTGIAIAGYTTFITTDSGRVWEPIPRDNNFSYLGYNFRNLLIYGNQLLWCGGDLNFLELNTNLKGPSIAKAFFAIDTAGLDQTGMVNLVNYSRSNYSYQWFLNGALISEKYNTSYTHDIQRTVDTIRLVVRNGSQSDTLERVQFFYPPVIVRAFHPDSAATGNTVTITGENFTNVTSVSFGGLPAQNFSVLNPTTIEAVVGGGASGEVKVQTSTGRGQLNGFTYIPPPEILSFTPAASIAGTTVTITGNHFTGTTSVLFGGIAAVSFNVVSPTSIIAVTPSGPSGQLKIDARGGSVVANGYVTLPSMETFMPSSGTEGTVMHIRGTSLNEITSATIGGIPVNSFHIDSSRGITALVGPGASGIVEIRSSYGKAASGTFTWLAPPVITGFSPALGPVGTKVEISGTGFATDTASNLVFFGSVQARVVAATENSLQVIVPVGALYAPISVTRNNLMALSSKPFHLTFKGGGSITSNSFSDRRVLPTPALYFGRNVQMADFDRDGRNDLIAAAYTSVVAYCGALVYRNISVDTGLQFEDPIVIRGMNDDYFSANVFVADFDGDGWLDLIGVNGTNLAAYRNISTKGHIVFETPVFIAGRQSPKALYVADVDGDGKVDVLSSNNPEQVVSIFKNTSEPGKIDFHIRVDIPVKDNRTILAVDLDKDDKPELVISDGVNNYFYVLKNQCTKSRIEFSSPQRFDGYAGSFIAAGDLDRDGNIDLVCGDRGNNRIALLRNITQPGLIQWDIPRYFETQSAPWGITLGDLDGDSSIDVAVALLNRDVSIYKNRSAPGDLSLLPAVNFTSGYFDAAHQMVIGDLDGDGRNDIFSTSEYAPSLSVYRNRVVAEPYVLSFTPSIGAAGTAVQITGGKFYGVKSILFGNTPAASFLVQSDSSITAIVGAGATGDITVSNDLGSAKLGVFVYGFPPLLTSVEPLSGPIGSRVTLKGKYLVMDQIDPIVRFGKVNAKVISASESELLVEVPAGAALETISVTAGNRTGYASSLFTVTFKGGVDSFTQKSFEPRIDRYGGIGEVADLDGDGRPDLVSGARQKGIRVIRNLSKPGLINLASDIYFGGGNDIQLLATGDLNGDGRPDIAATNETLRGITLFRNASTPGTILLAPGPTFTNYNGFDPKDIAIRDVDADGKPDIIMVSYSYRLLEVYRNLSTADTLRFDEPLNYYTNAFNTSVELADLDNDHLPEIVASTTGGLWVMKNYSRPGSVRFLPVFSAETGSWPSDVEIADMDGDKRIDLVLSKLGSPTLSIFLNATQNNQLAFSNQQYIPAAPGPYGLSLGDLDGDGKVDISTQQLYTNNLSSLIRNASTPGQLDFLPAVDYQVVTSPSQSSIADIDGDGRADMIIYIQGAVVSIFRNQIGWTDTLYFSSGMDTALRCEVSGSKYQWQVNTGNGYANITDNANYSGASLATLSIKNLPLDWNGYTYRCLINGDQSSKVLYLDIVSTDTLRFCAETDTILRSSVSGITYQWQVNTGNGYMNIQDNTHYSGSNTSTLHLRQVPFEWNQFMYYCVINGKRASRVNRLALDSVVTPRINISGITTVDAGSYVTLNSTHQQGGTNPTFQWQDSTQKHNWTNISGAVLNNIYYSPEHTQDKVRCIMFSNARCAQPNSAISNTLTFTVNLTTGIGAEPAMASGIRIFPNPVKNILTLTGLRVADQWQSLEIFDMQGRRLYSILNLRNRTFITVDLQSLTPGHYTLLLKSSHLKVAYFKLAKW